MYEVQVFDFVTQDFAVVFKSNEREEAFGKYQEYRAGSYDIYRLVEFKTTGQVLLSNEGTL